MIAAVSPYADVQRVLAAIALASPRAAKRADGVLRRLLRDIDASPFPENAWKASGLTGDGYPVEFTFTSRDDTVRYTVAPFAEEPPGRRPAAALALAAELSGRVVPGAVADGLLRLADGSHQRPPDTWIGVRHDEDPALPDRLKVYVRVAPERKPETGLVCDPAPALDEREVQLRLYGYEPGADVHERYFRVRRPRAHHLNVVMRQAGVGHRAAELVDLLGRAYGHPLDGAIPGGSAGFSLAGHPAGPPVFTLFVFARALWGGDARIRLGVARIADESGRRMRGYERASAPLAGRDVHATHHGMAAFVVHADDPIHLAVGLRPPPRPACA